MQGRALPMALGAQPTKERADAARNRVKVLAAAEKLFRERSVATVTMDDIAAEAGVGKGTLYRRFTDKGELAAALLSERGRELQERLIRGEPPLGPGAPAADRLVAFTRAYLEFQVRHLELVLLSETSTGRLHKGAYAFWRQHCTLLLGECRTPHADVRAAVLLAALSAEQVRHWVQEERRPVEQLAEALTATAVALSRS